MHTSQHSELLADNANNGGTVVVVVRDDLEGPAGLVPRGPVRVLLLGAAAAATQTDGDTKDADAAAGARCLLQLGVESLGSRGTDADLVAQAADYDDLADPGKSLDVLGSVCAELVLGNIDVPVRRVRYRPQLGVSLIGTCTTYHDPRLMVIAWRSS